MITPAPGSIHTNYVFCAFYFWNPHKTNKKWRKTDGRTDGQQTDDPYCRLLGRLTVAARFKVNLITCILFASVSSSQTHNVLYVCICFCWKMNDPQLTTLPPPGKRTMRDWTLRLMMRAPSTCQSSAMASCCHNASRGRVWSLGIFCACAWRGLRPTWL